MSEAGKLTRENNLIPRLCWRSSKSLFLLIVLLHVLESGRHGTIYGMPSRYPKNVGCRPLHLERATLGVACDSRGCQQGDLHAKPQKIEGSKALAKGHSSMPIPEEALRQACFTSY